MQNYNFFPAHAVFKLFFFEISYHTPLNLGLPFNVFNTSMSGSHPLSLTRQTRRFISFLRFGIMLILTRPKLFEISYNGRIFFIFQLSLFKRFRELLNICFPRICYFPSPFLRFSPKLKSHPTRCLSILQW